MGRTLGFSAKILLLFGFLLTLASCSFFDTDMSALLSPPSPVGELREAQDALKKFAGENITLKHPSSGDFLSPIILTDLTGDGENEAIAFYSTEADGEITMHMSYISKQDGNWNARSDASLSAGGVDNVIFKNLDDDKELEIIVGWGLFGSIEKQVAVYDLTDGSLAQRLMESYTQYVICDLDADSRNEILVTYMSKADMTATAKLYALGGDGLQELGSCALDAAASEYSAPVLTALSNGTPAVYIDAIKDKGMITEVLFLKNGALTNAFFDATVFENTASYRPEKIYCRDFDSDSSLEIPLLSTVPTEGAENGTVYLTRWCSFDGENLFSKKALLMNETDGYSLAVPDRWLNSEISIVKNVDTRVRTISVKSPETEGVYELLRIRAFELKQWEKQKDNSQYEEIVSTDKFVITAYIGNYTGPEAVTSAEVKTMISPIIE